MLLSVGLAFAAGIPLVTIARRIGLPPILLLTAAGVLIGPGVLGDAALVDPADLGRGLEVLVALAVGLILFEGGLTLDRGVLREAPVVITRLLTVGVFVTLLVGTLALVFLADRPWREALLGASLVVVTGPTVIGPLLKRVRLNERLHGILHWEGVVIDPIGVFVALLCFEIAMSDESGGLTAVVDLVVRVLGGSIIGIIGGRFLLWLHRRDLMPDDLTNVFTLSVAVGVFTVAESIRSEAGVLAATVAGYTLGFQRPERLRHLRAFKEEIVFLLIGALFILLAGRLDFERFESFGMGGLLAVLAMMFVARPLSIVLCTWGSELGWNERTFLAWVAPRGIVAASMASLFALALERANPDDVGFVETFTWSVILATILLQATTAGPLAGLLGLRRKHP
jgi:NhaP-type Na+/H+ or K+/H+ antiporter